jgi:hypothetical protein
VKARIYPTFQDRALDRVRNVFAFGCDVSPARAKLHQQVGNEPGGLLVIVTIHFDESESWVSLANADYPQIAPFERKELKRRSSIKPRMKFVCGLDGTMQHARFARGHG